MKWRDAVKAAIMHGCHSRCAVLVATRNATVTTGGQHGASAAEAQTRRSAEQLTDPAKRAYMRIPDEAKLWFVDLSRPPHIGRTQRDGR